MTIREGVDDGFEGRVQWLPQCEFTISTVMVAGHPECPYGAEEQGRSAT